MASKSNEFRQKLAELLTEPAVFAYIGSILRREKKWEKYNPGAGRFDPAPPDDKLFMSALDYATKVAIPELPKAVQLSGQDGGPAMIVVRASA